MLIRNPVLDLIVHTNSEMCLYRELVFAPGALKQLYPDTNDQILQISKKATSCPDAF